MMPVSGSTNTPILKTSVPTGNQSIEYSTTSCPKCSMPMMLKNTVQLNTHEVRMLMSAMVWLRALLRLVNNTIRKKEASGGTGISQVICSSCIKTPVSHCNICQCLHRVDILGQGIWITCWHRCRCRRRVRSISWQGCCCWNYIVK